MAATRTVASQRLPLPEAVRNGRPGTELPRHLTPLPDHVPALPSWLTEPLWERLWCWRHRGGGCGRRRVVAGSGCSKGGGQVAVNDVQFARGEVLGRLDQVGDERAEEGPTQLHGFLLHRQYDAPSVVFIAPAADEPQALQPVEQGSGAGRVEPQRRTESSRGDIGARPVGVKQVDEGPQIGRVQAVFAANSAPRRSSSTVTARSRWTSRIAGLMSSLTGLVSR